MNTMERVNQIRAGIDEELTELTETVDELETVVDEFERTLIESKLGGQSRGELSVAATSQATPPAAD